MLKECCDLVKDVSSIKAGQFIENNGEEITNRRNFTDKCHRWDTKKK